MSLVAEMSSEIILIRLAEVTILGILPISAEKDGNNTHDSVQIKSSKLRTAIEKGLEMLGKSSVEALVSELGRRGIDFDNASARYDLKQ